MTSLDLEFLDFTEQAVTFLIFTHPSDYGVDTRCFRSIPSSFSTANGQRSPKKYEMMSISRFKITTIRDWAKNHPVLFLPSVHHLFIQGIIHRLRFSSSTSR